MSKLTDIQQLLTTYQEDANKVTKEELLNVLAELCNHCQVLEMECINLLQTRNNKNVHTTQTPFSWESLRREDSPFKCSTYSS